MNFPNGLVEALSCQTFNLTPKAKRVMQDQIAEALKMIFSGIALLQQNFSNRQFTIDGRLVGDIGEIVAAAEFDITLDAVSQATHDGVTSDGRRVQIKATFKESLTFRTEPDYYLGLQLFRGGRHDVVFNGPGRIITEAFGHRKGFGEALLSFPVSRLRALSKTVAEADRIPRREATGHLPGAQPEV